MKYVVGIDVGSTYTKAVLLAPDQKIAGRAMNLTGYKLNKTAQTVFEKLLKNSGLKGGDIGYTLATGYGRHRASFSDLTVTDLTATARGVNYFFPGTLTVLDVGGQTMKASRLDEKMKVKSFRLNDKCAAGTGAFLEKTARYMGYETQEIGALVQTSKDEVSISGVCAVFAESEVINQLSLGSAPADIMHGAMSSLVRRALQLLRRVRMEAPVALTGGIMRFPTMASLLTKEINRKINIPLGEMVQFTAALGAAVLARKQLDKKTLNAA